MNLVYLVAVGFVEPAVLDRIGSSLPEEFGFEVRRRPALEEPEYAYDERRNQYSSVLILKRLAEVVPRGAARLLGITGEDIFIPMLSFLYGQAQLGGTIALVSLARLRQEFYGLPPSAASLAERALKECMHEMGHTFGLVHCPDVNCAMSLSTTLRQVDAKDKAFCRACNILLRENIEMVGRDAAALSPERMK